MKVVINKDENVFTASINLKIEKSHVHCGFI